MCVRMLKSWIDEKLNYSGNGNVWPFLSGQKMISTWQRAYNSIKKNNVKIGLVLVFVNPSVYIKTNNKIRLIKTVRMMYCLGG